MVGKRRLTIEFLFVQKGDSIFIFKINIPKKFMSLNNHEHHRNGNKKWKHFPSFRVRIDFSCISHAAGWLQRGHQEVVQIAFDKFRKASVGDFVTTGSSTNCSDTSPGLTPIHEKIMNRTLLSAFPSFLYFVIKSRTIYHLVQQFRWTLRWLDGKDT